MKEFLIFIGLAIFDIIIWVILLNAPNSQDLVDTFLPLIFAEIAFFGCVILHKMNHKDKGSDEDDEDF